MAIFINLAIDCGHSREAADAVAAHFRGFTIGLPGVGDVECEISERCQHGHWFVGVWPRGLGYATQPVCRQELLGREAEIGEALRRRLAAVGGYRRALFGGEAFDTLWDGTPEEFREIDYDGMVFAESAFPVLPTGYVGRPFSPGYLVASRVPR
jgi:hypothetical protein